MSRVGGVRSPGRHHRDHAIEQCYTQTVLLTAHQIRTLDDGVVEERARVAPLTRRQVEGDAVLAVLGVPSGKSRLFVLYGA